MGNGAIQAMQRFVQAMQVEEAEEPYVISDYEQEDIAALRRNVPLLRDEPDAIVARVWTEYCEDTYCAGWLPWRGSVDELLRYAEKNW